jgi:hypothetical protein
MFSKLKISLKKVYDIIKKNVHIPKTKGFNPF